eukprot:TRINITY_DN5529_c3_g1_i1.p1 TRINITY_DN5529_c3_g1~~TRINITY_DN5529_c3_g1_i1.p1  ORF type:complete len:491 (+),score=81.98 TRINITY_DN5529_c3_g1_i1:578-2050(+)
MKANTRIALLLVLCVSLCASHISMWASSTFDRDRDNGNSDGNSQPLQDMLFNEWWWHNNLDFPPNYSLPNTTFQLPANGEAIAELSSNKAFTSVGYRGYNQRDTPDPWDDTWSNIHAPARNDVAGCAWAISYKSNQYDVKPEDFVVFSVVHDCVARQVQPFQVPNLPACPDGRCMCAWFWIHKSIGGSDQNYMTPFACNVTNVRADAKAVDVANAIAPSKCYDPEHCTQGPRNPMYWKNLEGNNMFEPGHYAPTYSILYGFAEGAQFDIFVNTNPVTRRTPGFPKEQICTSQDLNAERWSSRLTSNKNSTLEGDAALISPNCQWSLSIEQWSGNLLLSNTSDWNVVWGCNCRDDNNGNVSPYTLSINDDGELFLKDSRGVVTWNSTWYVKSSGGVAPYRLDLTNKGVLALFDNNGRNMWESNFYDNRENDFSSLAADPTIWPKQPTYYDVTETEVETGTNVVGNSNVRASLSYTLKPFLLFILVSFAFIK